MMKVHVATENGSLADKYGKQASEEYLRDDVPYVSFPISFENVPENAKSLALTLIDYDSVPVCNFAWIHWLVANIPAEVKELPENASDEKPFPFVQGNTSYASPVAGHKDPKITQQYGGPTPPDKDHDYTLVVYALDTELDLKDGYYLNEFYRAIEGHVIEEKTIAVVGRA